LLGELTRTRFGLFLRAGDDDDRPVRLLAGAVGHPRDPMRAASFAVDFVRSGIGRHGRETYQILAGFATIGRFRPICHCFGPSHFIESSFWECFNTSTEVRECYVPLTCPNCGNDRNFLVKTLQMHVVHLEDGRVEVTEETQPAVFEVLCDECETALKFEDFEDTLRKEVLLTIGAR
jgi:hypothetical protein